MTTIKVFKLKESMEDIFEALGATPIYYENRIKCCGFPIVMMNKDASDTSAVLTLLSSQMNPFLEINFNAVFPIGLSELLFDSTSVEPEYKVANLTMSYQNYSINSLIND